jgi:hypothetical protein
MVMIQETRGDVTVLKVWAHSILDKDDILTCLTAVFPCFNANLDNILVRTGSFGRDMFWGRDRQKLRLVLDPDEGDRGSEGKIHRIEER